tara:strand:+ start:1599 stop:1832 length:234 start_codon:yes stop_codon:yes gene_type:complete
MAWNQQDEERHFKGFADGDDDALTLAYNVLEKGMWNVDKTDRIQPWDLFLELMAVSTPEVKAKFMNRIKELEDKCYD